MTNASGSSVSQVLEFVDSNDQTWSSECSESLLNFADQLEQNKALGRALTDNGLDPAVRVGAVRDLLQERYSSAARMVIEYAVSLRWTSPGDLSSAVAAAGIRASLAEAEKQGTLDDIENEIFLFSRTVAANGELELALSDPAVSNNARDLLLDDLLKNRMNKAGLGDVKYVLSHRHGKSVSDALGGLVEMAASRRGKLLAEVVSAVPLDQDQTARLTKALEQIYGRSISVQNEVDSDVIGGIAVRVGDDLIDGTVAESLEQARRRITQGV